MSFDRCVVRYGYKDIHKDDDGFEDKLIEKLGAFIVAEDDVESETCSSDERDDGMMQASGMYRSSSLVHAVDNELTVKERFGRKKQPLAKSEVYCLRFSFFFFFLLPFVIQFLYWCLDQSPVLCVMYHYGQNSLVYEESEVCPANCRA